MHFVIRFHFNDQKHHAAETGVAGSVTDILLPLPGDTVTHRDRCGAVFTGKVTDRHFVYEVPDGLDVDGLVMVNLYLNPLSIH